MEEASLNALSRQALDAAFAVHNELGPDLLESSYVACLRYELEKRGLKVRSEVPLPVVYDGHKLVDVGYRIDLLVEGELIIEVKAVETIAPVHQAQLLSYLKHSRRHLGLLLNFNVRYLRDGIYRRVNRLKSGNAKDAKRNRQSARRNSCVTLRIFTLRTLRTLFAWFMAWRPLPTRLWWPSGCASSPSAS